MTCSIHDPIRRHVIDKEAAIKLITRYINEHDGLDEEMAIAPEATVEKDYGWIFFYNTKKYLESGVISYALAGNGPVIIEKSDGRITAFGTNKPVDVLINEYEHTRENPT